MSYTADQKRIIEIYNSFFDIKVYDGNNPPPPINKTDKTDNPLDLRDLPTFVLDAPPPKGFVTDRKNFIEKAYNEWWGIYPKIYNKEVTKACGDYTFNLAWRYIEATKNQKITPFNSDVSTNNNARSLNLRNNLRNLGYDITKIAQNTTKNAIISSIANTTFFPGDVIIYYANTLRIGDNQSHNEYDYGHTQIYVGTEIQTNDKYGPSNESKTTRNSLKTEPFKVSGWTSSLRDNYGGGFVYRNSRYSNPKWDLWIARSPK